MITPEEDFETWTDVLLASADLISQFTVFMPQISNLIDEIIENGQLKEPITIQTNNFIDNILNQCVNSMLSLTDLTEEENEVVLTFLKKLIDLSLYGLKEKNESCFEYAMNLMYNPQYFLFTVDPKVPYVNILCEYSEKIGLFSLVQEHLEKNDLNFEFFIKVTNLYLYLCQIIQSLDFQTIVLLILTNLIVYMNSGIRNVPTNQIQFIMEFIISILEKNNIFFDQGIDKIVDVSIILIKSEIFEKQKYGFELLLKLLHINISKRETIHHFDDIKLLMKSDYHEQFFPMIGSIIGLLSQGEVVAEVNEDDNQTTDGVEKITTKTERKVTMDTIRELWDMRTVQHCSTMNDYLQMFVNMCSLIPTDFLVDFVNMILVSDNYGFINSIADNLGNREDSQQALAVLRKSLMDRAFGDQSNDQIIDILSKVLRYQLTDDEFNTILNQMIQKDTHTMMNVLKSVILTKTISYDVGISLLKRAINFAKENINNTKIIKDCYEFIFNIQITNHYELSNDIMDLLFSMSEDSSFYFLALSMINSDLLPLDYIQDYLMKHKNNDTKDQQYCNFVAQLIYKLNYNETGNISLPFKGQDLLWELSLTKTYFSGYFAKLLTHYYLMNDENIMPDLKMINIFLNDWMSKYNLENEEESFHIMNSFINDYDITIDLDSYGIIRHMDAANNNLINIEVSGQFLQAPFQTKVYSTTSIYVIMLKVSEFTQMPMDCFKLHISTIQSPNNPYNPPNELYITQNLQSLMGYLTPTNTINFQVEMIRLDQRMKIPHQREYPACLIIGNSPVAEIALDATLKRNSRNAQFVINLLPHNLESKYFIKNLQNIDFDFDQIFPINCPFKFFYNIETFAALMTDDYKKALDEKGFISSLINVLTIPDKAKTHQFFNHIAVFLRTQLTEDLKIKYSESIFNSTFPNLKIFYSHNAINEFNQFYQLLDIVIPSEVKTFYPALGQDLLYLIRKDDVKLRIFSYINKLNNLPFSIFTEEILYPAKKNYEKLLHSIDQNNANLIKATRDEATKVYADIYQIMLPHLPKEFDLKLFSFVYDDLTSTNESVNHINLKRSCLELIEKMLQTQEVPQDNKTNLSTYLIDEFLTIDERSKNKDLFVLASRCLSLILCNPELDERLKTIHSNKSFYGKWNISGDIETRENYSGLTNLGCTCFFNSILQQFYGIPEIRIKIIGYDGDDMFTKKLKELFAKMTFSNLPYQNTKGVVKYFQGWDGEPLNPMIQQDACEFLQVFLDKLEQTLGVDFIHSLFKGTTINCIDGISAKYHSEREEQFYTFPVAVKNHKDLLESIDSTSAPDFLTGTNQYKAENIGLIDAKKSILIGELPPYFVIQLQRFEYEYQTMTRTKIDSKFTFPVHITLKHHIKKDNENPEEDDQSHFMEVEDSYDLSGVIVHMGGADFGHYISYVRDRETNCWYCCNDENTKIVTIEEVCQQSYGYKSSKNGYLLFYDKSSLSEDKETLNELANIQCDTDTKAKIIEQNNLYNEYRLLCSTGYLELMLNIAKNKEQPPETVIYSIAYFFDTLPYTVFTDKGEQLKNYLSEHLKNSQSLCKYVVSKITKSNMFNSLLYQPDKNLRIATLELLILALKLLSPKLQNTEEENEEEDTETTIISKELVQHYIFLAQSLVPYARLFNEFFELIAFMLESNKTIVGQIGFTAIHILLRIFCNDLVEQSKKYHEYYSNLDLTGFIHVLLCFPIKNNYFEQSMIQNQMFYCLLSSNTKVYSIVRLYKELIHSGNKDNFLMNCCYYFFKNTNLPLTTRNIEFILEYFNSKQSFAIIQNRKQFFQEQAQGNPQYLADICSNFEICSCLYEILRNCGNDNEKKQRIKEVIYDNFSSIVNYLFDIKKECRNGAARLMYALNPCKELEEIPDIFHSDFPPYDKELDKDLVERLNRYAMRCKVSLQHSYEYLNLLYHCKSLAASYLLDDYYEYLLYNIPSVPFTSNQNETKTKIEENPLFKGKEMIFSDSRIITLLQTYEANNMTYNNNPLKCIIDFQQTKVNIHQIIEYFSVLYPHLINYPTTEESAELFLKKYCFLSLNQYIDTQKYDKIIEYMKKCCREQRETTIKYIQSNFSLLFIVNMSALSICAEILDLKFNFVPHLFSSLKLHTYLSPNELVEKAFACDDYKQDKEKNAKDGENLVKLLNFSAVTGKARDIIWRRIIDEKVPFASFLPNYKGWLNDKEKLAEYLIFCVNETPEIKDHPLFTNSCKKASLSSQKSFAILSDILLSHKEMINNKAYVLSILSSPIKDQNDTESLSKLIIESGYSYPIVYYLKTTLSLLSELMKKRDDFAQHMKDSLSGLQNYILLYKKASVHDEEVDKLLNEFQSFNIE